MTWLPTGLVAGAAVGVRQASETALRTSVRAGPALLVSVACLAAEGSVRLVNVAALCKQHGPFGKSGSGRAAGTTMDDWRGRSPGAGTGDR